jgi:hypothetical protein
MYTLHTLKFKELKPLILFSRSFFRCYLLICIKLNDSPKRKKNIKELKTTETGSKGASYKSDQIKINLNLLKTIKKFKRPLDFCYSPSYYNMYNSSGC